MNILVLGANGMIGNAMVRVLSEQPDWQVFGTVRSEAAKRFFDERIANRLLSGVDVELPDSLQRTFALVRPSVVINCVGLVKQHSDANDAMRAIPLNALLPHRLARLCDVAAARLVHISSDCVYSGSRGGYLESDIGDASDLYGRSKLLGEVTYPHTVTLRTSGVGHELQHAHGLLAWFLSQDKKCKGFTKAIFSGVPTVVLAQIVRDIVIPNDTLSGLYHVAAAPIDKYTLLKLFAAEYEKEIEIVPDDSFVIDRSLNADRFRDATGYVAPDWPALIATMRLLH